MATPNTEQKISGPIFDRDTILHLRLPFSLFLFPIFLFGISQATNIDTYRTTQLFIALHFFIYPGSNVYNSFMDKDTGSIGGLRNPPPATRKLYYASIIMDAVGLVITAITSPALALLMLAYIGASKAYSWHGIRIKKYAWGGWLFVLLFQGGYTYMLANMAATNNITGSWFTIRNAECMLFASLMIGGFYPITQVYQHEEDNRRGDHTLSYWLGVNGTFIFAALLFALASATAYHYFITYYTMTQFIAYMLSLSPVVLYFGWWFARVIRDHAKADYTHTMRMNKLGSLCMLLCFSLIFYLNHR